MNITLSLLSHSPILALHAKYLYNSNYRVITLNINITFASDVLILRTLGCASFLAHTPKIVALGYSDWYSSWKTNYCNPKTGHSNIHVDSKFQATNQVMETHTARQGARSCLYCGVHIFRHNKSSLYACNINPWRSMVPLLL